MKILVTGGAGYIGSHMVRILCDRGYDVVVVDSLIKGHEKAVDSRAEFVKTCLSSKEEVVRALKGCDAVMHFAAFMEVGISMQDPYMFFENNNYYGIRLLEAMRSAGVKNMIFSSTAALFGNPEYTPIDEKHPKNPDSFYGQTKLYYENLLGWYDRLFGIKSVSLRYFNAAGADESCKIGEVHTPETHIIPLTLQAAQNKSAVSIYGTDYDNKDGTCVRDYIHVNDLSDAHILALKHLMKTQKTDAFNLGTGVGSSVKEVVESCRRITGKDFSVVETDRRPGDPATLVASSERAKKILGWDPKYTSLDPIIKTAWRWQDSHPEGY